MDLVSKLITLSYYRAVVRPKSIPRMTVILREELKDLGFFRQSDISEEVLLVLVQEACGRAAEKEKDKLPRYGRLDKEIEFIAGEIVAAFEDKSDVDPRIRSILEFHHQI